MKGAKRAALAVERLVVREGPYPHRKHLRARLRVSCAKTVFSFHGHCQPGIVYLCDTLDPYIDVTAVAATATDWMRIGGGGGH